MPRSLAELRKILAVIESQITDADNASAGPVSEASLKLSTHHTIIRKAIAAKEEAQRGGFEALSPEIMPFASALAGSKSSPDEEIDAICASYESSAVIAKEAPEDGWGPGAAAGGSSDLELISAGIAASLAQEQHDYIMRVQTDVAEVGAIEAALAASLQENAMKNAAAAGGGEQGPHHLRSIYETIAIYKENPANYKEEIFQMAFDRDIHQAARGDFDLMSEMQQLIVCAGLDSLFNAWPPQE